MTASAEEFKEAFAHHPSGVCVLLWRHRGGPSGITLTSASSASVDPPLFTFSVARRSRRLPTLLDTTRVDLNMLASDQADLASALAGTDPDLHERVFGSIVAESAGRLVVRDAAVHVAARVTHHQPVGSSVFFVALVEHVNRMRDTAPLLYHQRSYGTFAPREHHIPA